MFLFASLGRTFWLTALAATTAVAVAGTAFTGSITVGATNAGTGTNTIGGYSISTPAFTLNGTNPLNVDAIGFNVLTTGSPATPVTAKVKADTSGVWYACSVSGTGPWPVTCDTTVGTQLTVANSNNLTVVVTQ